VDAYASGVSNAIAGLEDAIKRRIVS